LLLTRAQQDRLSQIERIKEGDDQKLRELNDLIDAARYKAKENRLNHMIILTSAAKLASSLGITEHNLDQIRLSEENFNLNIALGEENLPDWYLYGEKALIERIKLLENRTSDDPFIPELVTLQNKINEIQKNNLLKTLEKREDDTPFVSRINALDVEKIKLESFNIEQDNIRAMQLNQAAFSNQYSDRNKQILVLGILGGFMLSIFLALMMNLFKKDEA
jgi:LPS O-antigen subunit length determinant protein (WzzB/FepE family)|tara:strand:- start:304 stop:963 length:660 start_codon:yes stop_codon:yes gene_type:complete